MRQLLLALKKLNGRTFTVISTVFVLAGVYYFYGCESRVISLHNPSEQVNREELQAEFGLLTAKYKSRMEALNRQEEFKTWLTQQASLTATTGTINPVGVANSLISLFAIGYAVDSRRKLTTATRKNTLTTPA